MNGGCEEGKMTCGKCLRQTLSEWIFLSYVKKQYWRKEKQMKIQLIDFGGKEPGEGHMPMIPGLMYLVRGILQWYRDR